VARELVRLGDIAFGLHDGARDGVHDPGLVVADDSQHPMGGIHRLVCSHFTRIGGADARRAIHHTPNAESRNTTARAAQPSVPFVTAAVTTSGETIAEIDQLSPKTPW